MPIVGTSGHVDHGKTLLIEALTGVNPDRLPEEKARGMTIDLGFAHFLAPDGRRIGVIDVPGHERFIRNMVAGAWGLDLALLCVAADDGWMPQSADHARVLRLLAVSRLILVVTKADLAPAQRAAEVLDRCRGELSRIGYPDVPALAVSAPTGAGIEALRAAILENLPESSGERRGEAEASGQALLYVDRVFSVRGTGLVATGTLRGGSLGAGAELRLWPGGQATRVRGLQSYHAQTPEAPAGSRVALNLPLRAEQLRRGDCLAAPAAPVTAARELLVRLSPPPGSSRPLALKGRQELEVAIGTGHWRAHLVRLPEETRTGAAALGRLLLESAAPVAWGQPLVLIPHGGTAILGGGEILWVGPASKPQQRRLAAAAADLPGGGLTAQHLRGLRLAAYGAVLDPSTSAPPTGAVRLGSWLVLQERLGELEQRLVARGSAPGGVRLEELGPSGAEEPRELLQAVADALVARGTLHRRAGVLLGAAQAAQTGAQTAQPAAAPNVSPMGRQLLERLRQAGRAGLELPKLKIAGAQKELRALARAGLAVSLDASIYYSAETYREVSRAVLAGSAAGQLIDIPTAKARSGLTRKFIIPLLNRMEADGLLKREGDARRVRDPS